MSDTLLVGVSAQTARNAGNLDVPWLRLDVLGSKELEAPSVIWRRQHDATAWLLEAIDATPSVRWVHTDTSGVDRLPLDMFAARNIVLSNGRGAHTPAVSEWAFAAMLLGAKRLDNVVRLNDQRQWEPWRDSLGLFRRRVAILGMGSIGSSLGRICRAAGMDVVGVSRSAKATDGADRCYAVNDEWITELAGTSFLVNCLPSTPQTLGFVDNAVFAQLPAEAWFINVGRGQTVDEDALVEAVSTRQIAGAVLDTVINEPLSPDSALWHSNIVISPHISSFTCDTDDRTCELFLSEAEQYRNGLQPRNVIDTTRGY